MSTLHGSAIPVSHLRCEMHLHKEEQHGLASKVSYIRTVVTMPLMCSSRRSRQTGRWAALSAREAAGAGQLLPLRLCQRWHR